MGNNSCAAFDHYDYTSHKLDNTDTYAIGTGYNEKNKMLVMVHSQDEGSSTAKTIHVFQSSKDLNNARGETSPSSRQSLYLAAAAD